ncbi:MarR family transcriptional regulator [Arthrobacter sp. OAP107]|uniref:MarR family transcriptional regulator n=1 Tax=Arthrobacter sp. OAP107 TaxID=3156445 RepID=UPI003390A440
MNTPQLRVLVLIHTRGPQNPGGVAAELGVHASNATRVCDRLVAAELLEPPGGPCRPPVRPAGTVRERTNARELGAGAPASCHRGRDFQDAGWPPAGPGRGTGGLRGRRRQPGHLRRSLYVGSRHVK